MEAKYFKNDNGHTFFVVAANGDYALLRDVVDGKYVVAWSLNWSLHCWQGASYWLDDFQGAVSRYLEKIKEL